MSTSQDWVTRALLSADFAAQHRVGVSRRQLLAFAGISAVIWLSPACTTLQPVAESGFTRIGGVDQWIEIRGRDRSLPAILFLHGGPCEAQSPFVAMFAPWEERYVVAQWDQRGSGRSFEKEGAATPNMTLQQLQQDAIEVTQHVLGRLGARKLILVGHSWGAILGLSVVRSRPELFHAFVATGQPISGKEIIEGMRLSAVARAEAAGDVEAVAQLKALTPADYSDMSRLGIMFRWVAPFPPSETAYLATQSALLRPSGVPSAMADNWLSARQFCLPKLMQPLVDFDARSDGYELPVPYFVIQGRDDTRTPTGLAKAFVDEVRAPMKAFTSIEGAHFACFTNPVGFLDALDAELGRLSIR